MTKKPHACAMHAKTSEENIHATWYLQAKTTVVVDPDVFLCFLALPFPSFSKTPSMPHPPLMLQESLRIEEYERERIEESSTKIELIKLTH